MKRYPLGRFAASVLVAGGFVSSLFSGIFLFFVVASLMGGDRSAGDLVWPLMCGFVGGALIVAIGYAVLALLDIADLFLAEKAKKTTEPEQAPAPIISPPPAIEMEPTPVRGHDAITEDPEPEPKETREESVARRIAEYEERKKK
jgi:hypothetical protein